MGKGRGVEINLELILRVISLILVIVSLTLLMTMGNQYSLSGAVRFRQYSFTVNSDAFMAQNISASIFIITLVVILGILIIKDKKLDPGFSGVLLLIGALLLIGSGLSVAILSSDYVSFLVSGIMAIVAGVALLVDALKSFGVF